MSYNLGFMLSLFFLIPILLYSGDLICIQSIQSQLDAFSVTISHKISLEGEISQEIEDLVYYETGGEISCDGICRGGQFGEVISFVISKEFQPFIMSDKPITISVRREAIIGYYMG